MMTLSKILHVLQMTLSMYLLHFDTFEQRRFCALYMTQNFDIIEANAYGTHNLQ
jgi:hypothetical protein